MLTSVIIFIITLLFLVLIHELGHFLMARKFNIKVEEFGFGIPPKAWGKKVGETLVSINWLPLGGFVRLLGEDEVDKKVLEHKRSFAAQKVGKRIAVVVAGVTMNLVFAWFLFYIVLAANGFKAQFPQILEHNFVGANQTRESIILIRAVGKNSPAEKAGIKPGDRVVAINGEEVRKDDQIITKTKELAGQEITLTLSDPQKIETRLVGITPRKDPPPGEGAMGIALAPIETVTLHYETLLQKVFSAQVHSWNIISYSGKILGNLIFQSLSQKNIEPVSQTISGPVGIISLANAVLTSTENPLIPYLDFVALLSLNLAVMNLLPIPALDGGRLFFLLIEATTRKKVHAEVERWVHAVGMALLLALTVLITFSDIRKFFS
ncbi:site-2 protease family protein [Candidatus Daviesbacteria bacterium]|nr:site-2 protease family protein [Candidatus Daviesbacteria bacterium]